MGDKLYLIFNHVMTPEQEADAFEYFGVSEIVPLPDDLKPIWGNIPPDVLSLGEYLEPIFDWVRSFEPKSIVLVQGEAGATFEVVNLAITLGHAPVYATTKREVVEEHLPDGSVQKRAVFRHVRFRPY